MNNCEYVDNLIIEAKEHADTIFKTRHLQSYDIIMKLNNALGGLREELEATQKLLNIAQCPNCDGSGTVVTIVEGCEAGCCGNPHSNGECCGDPIPIETQEQQLEPCQWCYEVKTLKDSV